MLICAASLLLFVFSCCAQSSNNPYLKKATTDLKKDSTNYKVLYSYKTQQSSVKPKFLYTTVLPPNYYTASFGFICKKELAIEKATKIPFRFRLGSLSYCNLLEGK